MDSLSHMLGLATIDLCIKFKIHTHYEDMNGDEKCKHLGVFFLGGGG